MFIAWAGSVGLVEGESGKVCAIVGFGLFPDGGAFAALRLVGTKTTNNGVVIVTYQPAEPTTR